MREFALENLRIFLPGQDGYIKTIEFPCPETKQKLKEIQ